MSFSLGAWAGPSVSDGVGSPRTVATCKSAKGDVLVRIMKSWPKYETTQLVVLHYATLIPFSEDVVEQKSELDGAPSIYEGEKTNLTIQLTAKPKIKNGVSYFAGHLRTRPYGGDLKLNCQINQD